MLAAQRPVVEKVRRDTLSVCERHSNASQIHQGEAETDAYSKFDSTVGDEEFSFDDEIINSQAYRRVMKNLTFRAKAAQSKDKQPQPHLLDEPLIDLSSASPTSNFPATNDGLESMNHWFRTSKRLPPPLKPNPSSANQETPNSVVEDDDQALGTKTQEVGRQQPSSPLSSPKISRHSKTITSSVDEGVFHLTTCS